MKRLTPAIIFVFTLLFSCSSQSNYKKSAVEYLKTKVPVPASVDTIRFIKPDSIYTTFHGSPEYKALIKGINSFETAGDSAKVKELKTVIAEKDKTFKNILVGWDVRLIYKAKDKKGAIKTDTCRFTFDSTLSTVKDLNGVDL